MNKNDLKGKYVMFHLNGYRVQKVIKISGKTLTVKDATGTRTRIHPDKVKILGVLRKRKIRFKTITDYVEEIEWNPK